MPRFYLPDWKENEWARLPEEESKHCIRVLRHGKGDTIRTIDGKGRLMRGVIREVDPKGTLVEIREVLEYESVPPCLLELVVAPTKQMKRMEWMAEKCTEIGMKSLSFLKTRYGERPKISKQNRLKRIVLSAVKQSGRLWLPEIGGMNRLEEALEEEQPGHIPTVVASSEREAPWIGNALTPGAAVRVIIGPEGGFHEDELHRFDHKEIPSVSLGTSVLRTETAGVYVSAVWSFLKQGVTK